MNGNIPSLSDQARFNAGFDLTGLTVDQIPEASRSQVERFQLSDGTVPDLGAQQILLTGALVQRYNLPADQALSWVQDITGADPRPALSHLAGLSRGLPVSDVEAVIEEVGLRRSDSSTYALGPHTKLNLPDGVVPERMDYNVGTNQEYASHRLQLPSGMHVTITEAFRQPKDEEAKMPPDQVAAYRQYAAETYVDGTRLWEGIGHSRVTTDPPGRAAVKAEPFDDAGKTHALFWHGVLVPKSGDGPYLVMIHSILRPEEGSRLAEEAPLAMDRLEAMARSLFGPGAEFVKPRS